MACAYFYGPSSSSAASQLEVRNYEKSPNQGLTKAVGLPASGIICPLPLPLCVPQVTSASDNAPFVRAYNTALGDSGVEREDWLAFTDDLNVALTNPFISKALTERLLRNSNESYFAPRGLNVQVCSTSEMQQHIGLNAEAGSSTHSISTSVSITEPYKPSRKLCWIRTSRNIITRLHANASMDVEGKGFRGMAGDLHSHALSLDTEVPPPRRSCGIMGLGARLTEWKSSREVRPNAEETGSSEWQGGCKRRKRTKPSSSTSEGMKDATLSDSKVWLVLTNMAEGEFTPNHSLTDIC
ncbi:hypothetical protein FRB94_006818 [Tulasnella sp. JGI-2019a]|nr:hypothetical protein FRB93_010369 [Tulasnella sp. JGI-2019a]KAG9012018.1 hypothetical protein FRB94_006818 [Tulasnella sp. JGI-2019a]